MNIGLHGGLSDEKHCRAMKDSIWLYLWLVKRQTKPNGLVLGGAPVTYSRITSETGHQTRTLRRWMARLRSRGYIELTYLNYKQMRIRILKAKKFAFKQMPLPMEETSKDGPYDPKPSAKDGRSVRPTMATSTTKDGPFKQSGTLIEIEATATPRLREWIPIDAWLGFVEMRRKIRAPLTDHGVDLLLGKLEQLRDAGNDPREVIEQSVMNCWKGFFPVRQNGGNERERALTRTDAAAEEFLRRFDTVDAKVG